MRSLTSRVLGGREAALRAAVLALAALCASCMTPAARMHVDEISEWHAVHSEALLAFLNTAGERYPGATRGRLREHLAAARAEMASELHRIALQRVATCGATADGVALRKEKEAIRHIQDKIADAETASLAGLGDQPGRHKLTRELSAAQERLADRLASHQHVCASAVEKALEDALEGLAGKLESVVGNGEKRLSDIPEEWRKCSEDVSRKLTRVGWHVDELKKCRSLWHGDCNDPNAPPDQEPPPLFDCLDILENTPARMDELIGVGVDGLERHSRKAAAAIRRAGPGDSGQGSTSGGAEREEAEPPPAPEAAEGESGTRA